MENTNKEYFTEKEAIEAIMEVLENEYSGYYADLHNEVFNTDYYIIGTNEAIKALNQYGGFTAIQEIIDYEEGNFGDVATEFGNPEAVANMLWYIKGYEALENAGFNCVLDEASEDLEIDADLWNSDATPEVNSYIVRKLQKFIDEKL